MESLNDYHRICGSDLDELVKKILGELGISLEVEQYFADRPDVRTIEGLVLLVDFAFRTAKGEFK
jgi:hypothetical protein